MRLHLTQDVLIQYQFDLLDDPQRNEAAAHLEECGQCRKALEGLKQRFSALDVLDNEEVLSDELVQKTIASIHQSKEQGLNRRRMWVKWVAIAAGIVLAAAIVFMEQDYWKEQSRQILNTTQMSEDKNLTAPEVNENIPGKEDTFVAVTQTDGVRIVPQDRIPDKPPFAPASPANEEVELNLGTVSDVVVNPILMDSKTDNYRFDKDGNINGWDEIQTFRIEVKNTRDLPVKLEIKRNFNTQYWTIKNLNDSKDYFEKVDLDTVKYTLTLEPQSEKTIDYVLTTFQGTRQQDWKTTIP